MNARRDILVLLGAALAALAAASLPGCSSAPPRFVPGTVITRIADDADIPEPSENEFRRLSHHIENFVLRQARTGLSPTRAMPAEDVNRLGRVPDSSWYTNRIGALSPRDVAAGPGGDDPGPEAFKPWKVTGLKIGGRNPGFNFEDSRGARYICKFDKRGEPVTATAAGAVAARLLWALGYFVPDDRIVYFRPGELEIAAGATVKEKDRKRPLDRNDIDRLMTLLPCRTEEGGYRALVSRFLEGSPRGGYDYAGVRDDDPNDRIPHQRRRSLRGLRVFGAWLNHVDQKFDNTLDLYIEQDGRRFLRHYLVDFDGCLGGYWAARHEKRIGFAYDIDFREILTSMPTLGLWVRPYERLEGPANREIGMFEADIYDPAAWRANYVNDALCDARAADIYWAGTVLARMTDQMIEAAVASGRYHDPAAAPLLVDVLKRRRDKTLRWALTRVSPVEGLSDARAVPAGLLIKARDLPAESGLIRGLTWRIEALDADHRPLRLLVDRSATPAVTVPADLLEGRDYLIVRWIATATDGRAMPPSDGHYGRSDGAWGLWGVLRDSE